MLGTQATFYLFSKQTTEVGTTDSFINEAGKSTISLASSFKEGLLRTFWNAYAIHGTSSFSRELLEMDKIATSGGKK